MRYKNIFSRLLSFVGFVFFLIAFWVVSFPHVFAATTSPPIPGDWELVFEDEFDGTHLNPQKWRVGSMYLDMAGMASIYPDNIYVSNGNLVIKGEKKSFISGGRQWQYASGEVSTFQKFRLRYGYFEARIKYDPIVGLWPAFWTMPDRGEYGQQEYTRESYLKFDLSSTGDHISSAKLRLMVTSAPDGETNITIHRTLTSAWNENELTWNNKPEYDPVWLGQFTGNTNNINQIVPGQFIELDVTNYINQQLSSGTPVAAFAVVDTFMKDSRVYLGSKESSSEVDKPRLVINDTQITYPTDDAYVRGGNLADHNYGNESQLIVKDTWADTSNTFNGGMEIDIMESLGIWGPDKTQHAVHWNGYGANHKTEGSGILSMQPTDDNYHVYAMNWSPGKIDFYIDGVKRWMYEDATVGSVASYILLSHQFGGWSGNHNIDDASLPGYMHVDYVRVYKKLDIFLQSCVAPDGTFVQHGDSYPFYDTETVQSPDTCDNHKLVRVCTDGEFSETEDQGYVFAACHVESSDEYIPEYQISINLHGSWIKYKMYDDGTHGDLVAGDGTHTVDILIPDASVMTWYVEQTNGDVVWPVPESGGGSWSVTDTQNQMLKFTYNTTFLTDAWLPNGNLGYVDDIPLDGDAFYVRIRPEGTESLYLDQQMHDDGTDDDRVANDGIYTYHATIEEPGMYYWWIRRYPSNWDQLSWGKYGKQEWAQNFSTAAVITTTQQNQDVYFYLNLHDGRIRYALNAPAQFPDIYPIINNINGAPTTTQNQPQQYIIDAVDDTGSNDGFQYAVKWNTNTAFSEWQSSNTFEHTFVTPGKYSISFYVKAASGLITSKRMNVLVKADANLKRRADVNNDTQLDTLDAEITLKKVIGLNPSGWVDGPGVGDVNCDDMLTVTDALFILRKVQSLPVVGWCDEQF